MKYNPSRTEFKVELEPWLGGQFVFDLSSLYAHFKVLTDQRKARGIRYQLADGLTLITLAKLGGGRWADGDGRVAGGADGDFGDCLGVRTGDDARSGDD